MARSADGHPKTASSTAQATPSTTSSTAGHRATDTAGVGSVRSPEGTATRQMGEHSRKLKAPRFADDVPSVGVVARSASRERESILGGGGSSPSNEEGHSGGSGSHSSLEALPLRPTGNGSEERVERLVDSLCEYSLAIGAAVPSREMALAEFEWRNGWFLSKVKMLSLLDYI